MTDKKISDLTAAGTVNDADIFPMVQSGDTKYGTIAQMKAAVAPSAATESTAGIVEFANQAEAESQTNDDKAMTALKVQQFLDVGTVIDGATGGNQGDGTINAKGLYVNGEEVAGGAAGMELISSSTPTGVATVTFSAIPQTYRGLLLICYEVSCNTGTRYLTGKVYTNSGANELTSEKMIFTYTAGTGAYSGANGVWGARTTVVAGDYTTATFKIMNYQSIQFPNTFVNIYPRFYEGQHRTSTGAIVSVRGEIESIIPTGDTGIDTIIVGWNSTGNFDNGTVSLYGIK